MSDNDSIVLQDASAAIAVIDNRYRAGDINVKRRLGRKRNEAFSKYTIARKKLVAAGVLMTDTDVAEMRKIKAEIDEAANTSVLLVVVTKLIKKLAGI